MGKKLVKHCVSWNFPNLFEVLEFSKRLFRFSWVSGTLQGMEMREMAVSEADGPSVASWSL